RINAYPKLKRFSSFLPTSSPLVISARPQDIPISIHLYAWWHTEQTGILAVVTTGRRATRNFTYDVLCQTWHGDTHTSGCPGERDTMSCYQLREFKRLESDVSVGKMV